MITKRYKLYKNFGKCLEISNGDVRALVTVDLGPRIIYYGCKGCNVMHEDIERKTQKGGEFFDKNFKPGEKWFLYGGHRTWKAEEDLYSYTPDNYPVKVERLDCGAIFTPAANKVTGLQQVMKVIMDDDGCVTVTESFKNIAETATRLSVWGLTVLRQGGVEIIPLNTVDTGLLPQQNKVAWPYNDKKDKRFTEQTEYIVLKQKRTIERAFKLGIYNHRGWAAYHYGKYLFVKKFHQKGGILPDYQCNFETYTNNNIMEMEVLSPFYDLQPGEEAVQEEIFELHKDVQFASYSDADINKALSEIGFNG